MPDFTAADPDFAARLARVLAAQPFMQFLGVRLGEVAPGRCELLIAARTELTQHGGSIHGGVIGGLADNAAGAAAATLTAADTATVTVEYKINYLVPAMGPELKAVGQVLRAGRNLIVAESKVYGGAADHPKLCAVALVTLVPMALTPRG
jgi:uncharacterized protein (TIGR00369 family)